MGLFHKKQKEKAEKITPDMAGYRPGKEWWPDLTEYRKAMLLHNISMDDLKALLEQYADINEDKRKIVCDFFYTHLPDDSQWIYLEFPGFDGVQHSINLWHYQNLMIWLSQKTDKEFCLAIPRNQRFPLFLSTMDQKNPYGDSCVGIYADRDFYFEIPSDIFEWGPFPTSPFDFVGFLKESFGFDTQWIPKVSQCKWEKFQIVLAISE